MIIASSELCTLLAIYHPYPTHTCGIIVNYKILFRCSTCYEWLKVAPSDLPNLMQKTLKFSGNVWFQKISIPPPRRELEILKGRGGQRPRKFQGEGGGGLYDRFSFQRSFDSIRI